MRRHSRFALITVALAATVTAMPAAYVLNGPKWGVRTVNYYVNPANADVTEAAAEAAVQAGAATWGSQSNADFRFYYMGRTSGTSLTNNGKNEVFFRDTANGGLIAETYWWADSSGHLVDADIVFYDGGMTFFTGSTGCANGIYIEDTAAHEFGHALGLGHSADPDATMYYMASWCSTSGRTLNTDDLAGVEALYPAGSGVTNTAPSVSISSPSSGSSFTQGSTVTLSGSASDQQDGSLSGSIVWTSSLAGQLGVGSTILSALPVGTQTITASVTDSGGSTSTRQVSVTIASAPTAVPAGPIVLTASLSRVKSGPRVDLRWSGASTTNVDVYRNGAKLATTTNDGAYIDSLGKRAVPGAYAYAVCNAGTTTCSSTVSVVY
jgi:Matrixin/Bacterial Ig domain